MTLNVLIRSIVIDKPYFAQSTWHHSGVFVFNFEHILHLVLVFLLLTLNMQLPTGVHFLDFNHPLFAFVYFYCDFHLFVTDVSVYWF